MRERRNRTKSVLALLLSAVMIISTVPVSWAAEEEAVVVVEDTEVTGQSETIVAPELLQGEASVIPEDSQDGTAVVPDFSQDGLSVEEIVVEDSSEPVQPEAEGQPAEEGSLDLIEAEEQAEAAEEVPELELLDTEEAADPAEEEHLYWVDIWEERGGVFSLLPGESMTLNVGVSEDGMQLGVDEYEIRVTSSDESAATVEEKDVDEYIHKMVVTAAEDAEDGKEITITATAFVGGEEVSFEVYEFCIRNGYWVLTPTSNTDIFLYPGQTWDSWQPGLAYYEVGQEPWYPEEVNYEWVYEPEGDGILSLDYGSENDVSVTMEYYDENYEGRNHVELRATIPGDEDFGEVVSVFEFRPGYNEVWVQDNFEERENHFAGDKVRVFLNPDDIFGDIIDDHLSIEWRVDEYDEPADDWIPTTKASIEKISDFEVELTCKEEGRIRVSENLSCNGRDAGYGEIFYNIISSTEEYNFNEFNETLRSMPDRDYWINSVHYYGQTPENPDGIDEDLPVKDVSVRIIDGREDCITCEYIPEEENYHIRVNSMGTAEITITYQTIDGGTATHTSSIICDGEQYNMAIYFDPDNNGRMQPNGEVEMKLEVQHEYLEDGEYRADMNPGNIEVEWSWEKQWGEDLIVIPNDRDPYICTVKAPENGEYGAVDIFVKVSVDGKVVGEDERYVSVENYFLDMGMDKSSVSLGEGEEFTVTPSLYRYNPETGEEKAEGVRYLVRDYDMGVVEVTGEGGNYSEDGFFESAVDGSFTVRRQEGRTEWTSINITAQVWNDDWADWEDIGGGSINLDGLDYNVWFDIPEGGNRMFLEGQETLELRANTDALRRDPIPEIGLEGPVAYPEFRVGVWDGEELDPMTEGSEYTVREDEYGTPSIVTLDCGAAKKWLEDHDYCERDEEGNIDIWSYRGLHIETKVNGEDRGLEYIEVKPPHIDFEDGDGRGLSPGDSNFYTKGIVNCYVEDAGHPAGEVLPFKIKDVRFLKMDEYGGFDVNDLDTSGIATKETESDGTIRITARKEGSIWIQFITENDEYGEQEFFFWYIVNNKRYVLELSSSTGAENALPGSSFTINPTVYQITYLGDDKPEDERYENTELSPDQYTLEFTQVEGDDRIQVDGRTGKVTVSDSYGDDESCGYRVDVTVRRSGDPDDVLSESSIYFEVVPCYYTVEVKDNLYIAPGKTVSLSDLDPKLKRFDMSHRDGVDESGGKAVFELISDNPDVLTVGKDGTTLTVPAEAKPEAVFDYTIRATKDKYGNQVWAEAYKTVTVCGHNFEETGRKEATCTEAGSLTSKCTLCGEEKVDEIPLKDHTPGEWETSKAATCTEDGEQVKKCTVCGAVLETKPVAKAGHTPGEWETSKAATCTEDGEQVKKCTVCGTVLETGKITAKGHSFGEWKTTTEPTAVSEGVQTRTCSVCGAAETKSVEKLPAIIKLDTTKVSVQVKKSTTVKVVEMAKGDSVVSWKSSKPKIAEVNSKGKITGKKKGTATITVTLKSGAEASVKVTVKKKEVKTTKITVTAGSSEIKNNKITMNKGQKEVFNVTLTPADSKDKVTFTSSDKKVVKVNNKGVLTAKKAGKAKIMVSAGEKEVVITVTVKK